MREEFINILEWHERDTFFNKFKIYLSLSLGFLFCTVDT